MNYILIFCITYTCISLILNTKEYLNEFRSRSRICYECGYAFKLNDLPDCSCRILSDRKKVIGPWLRWVLLGMEYKSPHPIDRYTGLKRYAKEENNQYAN